MQQSNQRESYNYVGYQRNILVKENPKSAQETNVTTQWKRILKVRE